MTINKIFKSCDEAVADIFHGASVMVGGFGSYGGLPINLTEARLTPAADLKEIEL